MSTLCWLRRDLRLHDHAALSVASKDDEFHVAFVFDTNILDKLKDKSDRRLTLIIESLKEIEATLNKHGGGLHILHGKPEEEIPKLAKKLNCERIVANRDYEPYAKARDSKINVELFKDSVIFEKEEVLTGNGEVYKVFTPYKNKWLEKFAAQEKEVPDYKVSFKNLAPSNPDKRDWYKLTGLKKTEIIVKPGTKAGLARLKKFDIDGYADNRDYPAIDGTSRLSPYIRHGMISIRDMVRHAAANKTQGAKVWLTELIWRDFYQMILDAHPEIEHSAFKPEYDQIKWRGDSSHFKLWCDGQTGFPLVDAAMRCFNETGLMHNRLRMVVASFLCKTLLLDWRLGEKYFADHLIDFDLAANNGGWQWSSSSGADAQPYFRIFNPYNQSEKFDPDGEFILKWCPELKGLKGKDLHRGLGNQIVSYETNRRRCLEMYSVVRKKK